MKNNKFQNYIKVWDENSQKESSDINIEKAQKNVKEFLRKNEVTDLKNLKFSDKEDLFLMGVAAYKKGELSLDDLSELCESLWWTFEDKNNLFVKTLMAGSELSFYERYSVESEHNKNQFLDYLKQVLLYKKS